MKILNIIILLAIVTTMPLISCSSKDIAPKDENNDTEQVKSPTEERAQTPAPQDINKAVIENNKDTTATISTAEPGMMELYKLMEDMANWLQTDGAVDYFVAKHKEGMNDNDIMKLKIFEFGSKYNFKSITHIDEMSAIYENEAEYKRLVKNIDKSHGNCMTRIANAASSEEAKEMFNLTRQGDDGKETTAPPTVDEAELQNTLNAIKYITEWIESPEFEKLFMANVKHKDDEASAEKILREKIPSIIKEIGFNSISEYEINIRKYYNNPRFKKESEKYENRSYERLQSLYKKLK